MIENKIQITELKEPSPASGVAEIMNLLYRKKLFIFLSTIIVTLAAIGISYLLPESFKSTSVLLPETDKSKLAGLGGLSDLASLAGIGGVDGGAVKLYPAILTSESVLQPVIYRKYKSKEFADSVNLIDYWKIKAASPELSYTQALSTLRGSLDILMDTKTSIISISLETHDPQVSADVVNSITAQLDKFMRTKRASNATKQRQWIETRLEEVKQDLATSENRLKDFRESNRFVTGSPLLMLEQDRLLREVQINGSIFAELKKQFELIKIEEIKNTPIINVMDAAVPAAKKEKPKRAVIAICSLLFALVGSAGYVYLKQNYFTQISDFVARVRK